MSSKPSHNKFLHGPPLIAAITSVCSAGFLLFGYDQGVMSGVVISSYWLSSMGNPSTLMIGTITALYDVGAVFGAIAAAFTTEDLGRKRTLLLGAFIVMVGGVLMGSSYERVQFMVARVITGIGIGYVTSVTPVYQSEISAAAQRGWQVCCQLSTMLFGLMLAYWINYGVYFRKSELQWRFPLLFQCVFAVYILVVTVWLPDTPRWLIRHDGNEDRGLLVLASLRGVGVDDVRVQKEKEEIMGAIMIEEKEEGTWGDLFRDNGIKANKRFYLALGIQFMQQMSGINIVTYYAPTLFQSSLGMSQERSLFLGCFLQLFYIIASFLTWWTIDRVGRRKLFITNAIGMCLVLIAEAICVSLETPTASIIAVIFIFAFEACFTWGWMATVWIYPPEILPLKIRAKGASLAAAADFLGNFLVVEITPPALENIGYKTYVIFAVLNVVNAAIVWCFYPETAGQSLETIDRLFVGTGLDFNEDYDSVNGKFAGNLQWSMVRKAKDLGKSGRQRNESMVEAILAGGAMEAEA
ncbi:hypothetical protein SS1G_11591 [Sclerotinia sclerotiorum 1980 UF-70]|uniref:Major facilitator superfamily (MFS) profile domain-containing protein n=2 Tax=Sclerotinia sclerotiorum (strain ATCC 18683 / 1980 / Ss-1) TaxID=665079 RepID=A7F1X0_SCLS1|nr:hypothetical protein SS1G_11591 [Sclerotinia sclerotiorum 1980 UF-70]APA11343.1 hypothetical protein sscle_07g061130 [Sclerotinia sclerotiorum 1980 UF-70]EDN95712.1 hypothetical protein SS1G_11591 [Sclerotinia sclerotiorum 1980 UF-70]